MRASRQLRQALGEKVHKYREILETPQDKRSAEQNSLLDTLDKDMTADELEIQKLERQEEREARSAAPAKPGLRTDPEDKGSETEQRMTARILEYRKRYGQTNQQVTDITEGMRDNPRATDEYRAAFRSYLLNGKEIDREEKRALSVGAAAGGGYAVPAEEFQLELIKTLDAQAVIRQLARKFTVVNAQSMGNPTLAADPADADWTTELQTGNEDATMAFGKREMRPWPVAKRIKASEKWLRATPLAGEALIRDRLGYKVGVTHSKAFNTADGVNKPLGLYTASNDGIPATQDVEIGNGAGAVDPDKVITARYALRPVYWPTARWHFHQAWFAKFRKLRAAAGAGDYLWQPGLSIGAPSTFLDLPYSIDEYAPAVTVHAAGVYGAVVGCFDYYWIVDALDQRIQRLEELYAETGQVGFIIRAESDAAPVLGEAFVRCLAAT
jgi:HK97 family phage major capsid protein